MEGARHVLSWLQDRLSMAKSFYVKSYIPLTDRAYTFLRKAVFMEHGPQPGCTGPSWRAATTPHPGVTNDLTLPILAPLNKVAELRHSIYTRLQPRREGVCTLVDPATTFDSLIRAWGPASVAKDAQGRTLYAFFFDGIRMHDGKEWTQHCGRMFDPDMNLSDHDCTRTLGVATAGDQHADMKHICSSTQNFADDGTEDRNCRVAGDAKARNAAKRLPTEFVPRLRKHDCCYCTTESGEYNRFGAHRKNAKGEDMKAGVVAGMSDAEPLQFLESIDTSTDRDRGKFTRAQLEHEVERFNGPARLRTPEEDFLRAHRLAPGTSAGVCPECGQNVTTQTVETELPPADPAECELVHKGVKWGEPPLVTLFFVTCVLHFALAITRLFWVHAMCPRVKDEEAAKMVRDFMAEKGVKVRVGPFSKEVDAGQDWDKASFGGPDSMTVMTHLMTLHEALAGKTKSDMEEAEHIRAAHIAYADLLVLLFTRDRGAVLKAKSAKTSTASEVFQQAIKAWLQPKGVKLAHYVHVAGHFGWMHGILAADGLDFLDYAGTWGECRRKNRWACAVNYIRSRARAATS